MLLGFCVLPNPRGPLWPTMTHRLFNALLAADHPSHCTFGVPEYHVPLIPNPSEHIDIGTLKPSHCYSHGISVTPAEPDFHAT